MTIEVAPDDSDDEQLFDSRTGILSPTGTLTDELKTKVDDETGLAFRRLVREADMDVAGALRDFVYLKIHGKTWTDMRLDVSKVKRDKLFGIGPIEAPEKAAA